MEAVEFLVQQLSKNGVLYRTDIDKAKEMVKEERQSEYTRGFDDGYQRKQEQFDYMRGKNHSCQNNFKSE